MIDQRSVLRSRLKRRLVLLLLPASGMAAGSGDWQYGGTVDLGFGDTVQSGREIPWRSKVTSRRLNEFSPNMGMFYLRKTVSDSARWGAELGAQAGYDTDGQVPSSDRLPGSGILRYLSRANVSYLAPVGRGLTLTAGLMNSFIGYESMFAKDNPNYTRSWIADYSPYYLIGAAAQYSFGESVSAGFYVLSDYDYLAYRNNRPKYGSQLIWTISPQWKLTQNLFIGSEQHAAGIGDWRYFSDSIVQWASSDISVALAYDVGTERMSDTAVQALWMGSALFTRWHIDGPWSIALRPEVYWDRDGRLTGSRQLVKAVTATVEYKFPLDTLSVALRGEYRYDRSTGKDGGFFQRPGDHSPLAADQHVLFFSCLVSLDRP